MNAIEMNTKNETIIDHKFCVFCGSKDIHFVCGPDYSQHECNSCNRAWVDSVVKIEHKEVQKR